MTKIYSILQLEQTCRDKPTTWRILLRTIIFDFRDLASCFAIESSPHSSLESTYGEINRKKSCDEILFNSATETFDFQNMCRDIHTTWRIL